MNNVIAGVVAGAVGTTALNVATYVDMAVRGRPASAVPEEAVKKLGESLGVSIGPREGQSGQVKERESNKQSGLGALSGFATGLAVGGAYGVVAPKLDSKPLPFRSLVAGLGAMAFSDIALTASGLTDPREWGLSGWASDLFPHLAYGLCTAFAFDALRS